MQIILSGNSPGELWGWIRPLAFKLREHLPSVDLSLYLFPCPYATGKEAEMARRDLGISTVFSPAQSIKRIIFGNGRSGGVDSNPILIHLGGDILYASLLARRLKAQAFAYQWGQKLWDGPFAGYFVSDAKQKDVLVRRGISSEKIKVVGDLVLDAIQLDALESQRLHSPVKGERLVTFFPGSREVEITHMLPFYLRVAELTRAKMWNVKFAVAVSPFISMSELASAITCGKPVLESSCGVLVEDEEGSWIKTGGGTLVSVQQGSPYQLMKQSDCIVTIPGTKSGEAGFLGRPMIVVLPTNKLEIIPYPGAFDLLGKVPVAGSALKRALGRRILSKLGFLSQPNILAGKEIVPEIVEHLTADRVRDSLIELLLDEPRRAAISTKLNEIYQGREPGALNIVHTISAVMTESLSGSRAWRFP